METKEILKQLRKNKGYSADYVAEQADIPAGSYKKYESGILNPGVPVLCKLADFYGVTTDYLLGREPQLNPFAGMNFKPVDDDEFIRLYSKLPELVKEMFVDTMAKLAQAQKDQRKKHVVRTGDLLDEEQAEETDVI